jgi:sulfur-carrier protein
MTVRLKFFSMLKKTFPEGEREVEISGPRTAREIFVSLFESREAAERFLPFTRFAINCEYVPPETLVRPGDELAFIPPVSGG